MGEIVLVEQAVFDGSAETLFEAIEDGRVPGWRVPYGERLRVGTPVSLRLDAPVGIGRTHLDVLGRVSALHSGRRLVIEHHQPWQGTVTLTATPNGAGRSQVRMVVALGESAPEWIGWAAGGLPPRVERTDLAHLHPVGLLMSSSGAAGVFGPATENLARLAVDEINADGGIGGRQVALFVGDDGSNGDMGAAELARLVRLGCRTVVTNVTSATFRRLQPMAAKLDATLVFTPINEGGVPASTILRLGERPVGQLRHSVPRLMKLTSESRWFLAGNDYCWPRVTNRVAERIIRQHGGRVVDRRYEKLGSTDFSAVIEAIGASGAELVISTFVGADEVNFEQQMYAAGLRDRCQTLSLALDESTRDYIGAVAGQGLWSCFGYFEQLDTPENRAFVARYRARFGHSAPPLSSISESVYEALHLYARAQQRSGTGQGPPQRVASPWEGLSFSGPRGRVRVAGAELEQQMYLAQVGLGGFKVEALA